MLPVESPFKTYTDLDGKPLDNGYVYFGLPNQNPETAPVTVYWDAAGTIPAAQPLRTVNGYIFRGGTPANVFFDGSYSEIVRDHKQRQVFFARNSDDFSSAGFLSGATGASAVGFKAGTTGKLRTLEAKLNDMKSLADYGAVGDGIVNDTDAITAALTDAQKNSGILMVGTKGSRFRCDNITIPPFISLYGSGKTFGMTDVYDSAAFNTCGSTILLNPGATIYMRNGSAFVDAHVFPYGMSFPQSASSAWVGTAITVNNGTQINTIDVVTENLLICGFSRAIDGYWCPRLICNNVNFDCNNGIRVVTAGDPIRFFNCHGWPFATIAGPVVTDAGARDRRSGSAFEFFTNADAGKVTNCFAFGYAVGFDINAANGISFNNCGADDYNLFTPLTSIGWRIAGACGLTILTACQSVAHLFGISMNGADDTNILQINGGLYGANSDENIHLLIGSLVVRNATLGAAKRAIGVFGGTNRLSMGGNVIQGITENIVLNAGSSPYIFIGDDNITQDVFVPMYNGPAIESPVQSAAGVALPMSGDNITIHGTTNIFGFTGGWPGRVVHLRFDDVLTLTDSATLALAGNFVTATNATLSLRFTSANQCYEVSRSTN